MCLQAQARCNVLPLSQMQNTHQHYTKAAYTAYLMSIQVYKINSNTVGKYSDLQHCMHGHDASLKYEVPR